MANIKWTEMEVEFIKRNAEKLVDREGARQLSEITGKHITEYSFRKKRQMLGIKKSPGRGISKLVI